MKRAITLPSIYIILLTTSLLTSAGCATTGSNQGASRASVTRGRGAPGQSAKATSPGARGASASERCRELLPLIESAARENDIDTALMVGIVRVESNFRNDVRSRVGAVGLTQCMPATARAKKCGPLDDPLENLRCGARVIKAFLKYYKDSIYLGLSGYNAGHGMPGRAIKSAQLPQNVDYVEKVLQAASRFEARGCDF